METVHTKGIFVLELGIAAVVGVIMAFFLGIKEWKQKLCSAIYMRQPE